MSGSRALGTVVLIGLVAMACSSGDGRADRDATVRTTFEAGPCPAPEPPVEALQTARCGVLVVPENRTKDNGRTIRLAVVTLPAQSPAMKPDPIVFLEGGPGGNAIGAAEFLEAGGVNRDRDVIVMAQRGTPFADPALQCTELDEFNARAVGLVYGAESTGEEHVAATRRCRDRLVEGDVDLSAYNTTENAADFAELKTALGIPEWNLYGYSYGTDLALTLMRDHPAGIRSVMIDSVVPPDKGTLGWTWTSAQEAFDNLFRACDAQPGCRERYPDLATTFTRLVSELEAQPLTTSAVPPQGGAPVRVVIDGGALVNWLVAAPFGQAPSAIDALAKGQAEQVATRLAAATGPAEPFGHGLTYGVFCSEWIPYEPESEILERGRRAFPSYPESVLRQAPQLPFETEDCRVWDVPKAPQAVREAVRSSIPTLVIAGSFDPKTSPQWAKYQADLLPNSTYVVIPGAGHWASVRSPCGNDVVTSFYNDPAKPDLGCVSTLTVPPFE